MVVLYTRSCLEKCSMYYERYNDENFEYIIGYLQKNNSTLTHSKNKILISRYKLSYKWTQITL